MRLRQLRQKKKLIGEIHLLHELKSPCQIFLIVLTHVAENCFERGGGTLDLLQCEMLTFGRGKEAYRAN